MPLDGLPTSYGQFESLQRALADKSRENAELLNETRAACKLIARIYALVTRELAEPPDSGALVTIATMIEETEQPRDAAITQSSEAPTDPQREAFAWLYQWAGAMNAPASILDNLSALASGEPAPHEWQYPAMPDESEDRSYRGTLRQCEPLLATIARTHPSVVIRKRATECLSRIDRALNGPSKRDTANALPKMESSAVKYDP
jgi:hypothetical protein